ncbi:hypothetical protein KFU94_48435 [Chloroflexi bacterium TSY]|nr:hypothetical protein [Chloroflexi bacterium TSY]
MTIIHSDLHQPAKGHMILPAITSSLRNYWTNAERYQKFLYVCGGRLLLSAFFHTGVLIVTGGSLQGDVSWRKPIIFGEAFGVTCLSLAWVMTFLAKRQVLSWILVFIFGVASIGEVFLITMQQWRGVPSHFNTSTPFDATVYGLMGQFVILVEIVIVVMTIWTFISMDAPNSLKWSIRAGMLLLVAALFFGNLITQNGSNTFGEAGAMKIPHALSLHALQILPLMAWLMLLTDSSPNRRAWTVTLGTVGYIGIVAVSAFQAFNGIAPFDLSTGSGLLLGISLTAFAIASIMIFLSLLVKRRSVNEDDFPPRPKPEDSASALRSTP